MNQKNLMNFKNYLTAITIKGRLKPVGDNGLASIYQNELFEFENTQTMYEVLEDFCEYVPQKERIDFIIALQDFVSLNVENNTELYQINLKDIHEWIKRTNPTKWNKMNETIL